MNPITTSTSTSPSSNGQTYRGPFAIMTVLFFMWGFITSMNDILIPRFKEAFTLDFFQAMLVQFAFFGAYFIGSLIYFIISATTGDPIARIGYKNGVVIGLLLATMGSALFWPAATIISYPLFLVALFIVGLGFAMLQIAANPYVTILGPERTASSRLNLAQAFNSVGTTIGPLVSGYLIFEYFAKTGVNGVDSVKIPYLIFSGVFLLLAVVFFLIHLPHVGEGKIEAGAGALQYPHVILGVLAIFMYVGGEVSIGSSIVNFLGQPSVASMKAVEASGYVSIFWGGMLIGRFMGAVELSEMKRINKQFLFVVIPLVGLAIVCLVSGWVTTKATMGDKEFYASVSQNFFELIRHCFSVGCGAVEDYIPMLVLCWALFQFSKGLAGRTLLVFGLTIVVLLATAIIFGGKLAMWCVIGVGLFTSIGWPNIFSLALDGMGVYKSQVSSLLVMAILGGALLPLLQGHIADLGGLQISYIVPLIAYAYVAFYGWKGHKIGRHLIPDA
ncbi:MAG TPA: sugar MFS transporter [Candidatus Methylacidiphilales bacterium]|nr:sugar MFS transporter [Candidatus Methylacidiphilales bacterium]